MADHPNTGRRSLLAGFLVFLITSCGPSYRLLVSNSYEVGEDATIGVAISKPHPAGADVVITRPDGSSAQQRIRLDTNKINVRFGAPIDGVDQPTFTERGLYRVVLRSGKQVLATGSITISADRLSKKLAAEPIAGFAPIVRFARPRQSGPNRWMSYGAVYESARHPGIRIQVVIDEAEAHIEAAWKPYEEQGALGVLADSNLRILERTGSVSITWLSSTRVIAIESATLRHVDKKFLRHFLTRYPSDLRAR